MGKICKTADWSLYSWRMKDLNIYYSPLFYFNIDRLIVSVVYSFIIQKVFNFNDTKLFLSLNVLNLNKNNSILRLLVY